MRKITRAELQNEIFISKEHDLIDEYWKLISINRTKNHINIKKHTLDSPILCI